MTILFGHPAGTPFAYNAALAHFENGTLESFCVPWMPSASTIRIVERVGSFVPSIGRLNRRYFAPLADAPKTQGRMGEMRRLLLRAFGCDAEPFTRQANKWLMQTMARHCMNARVRSVHAYEDCSLLQFQQAR